MKFAKLIINKVRKKKFTMFVLRQEKYLKSVLSDHLITTNYTTDLDSLNLLQEVE